MKVLTRTIYHFQHGKVSRTVQPLYKPSYNAWQAHIRRELNKSLYPIYTQVESVLVSGYDSKELMN